MGEKLTEILNRLSGEIDPGKFEERRFQREEGALIKRTTEIAIDALSESDFSVISSDMFKANEPGLILQHDSSNTVVGTLKLAADANGLRVWFVPQGNFTSAHPGQPSAVPLGTADEKSILAALTEQLGRIQFTGHP